MAKKILLIGVFTGLAHILSFYGVSFVVKMNADKFFLSHIAEIESAIVIILSVMSFGLQQVATRDIAINNNWKQILKSTQENRLSMGLFLALIGLVLYFLTFDTYFLIFLLAPLLALNIDYALYGKGFSVQASLLSLIKVGIPSIVLILLGYFTFFSINVYVIAIILGWLIIGVLSNAYLNHMVLVKPTLLFFKAYFKNVKIGFTDIAITALKLGVLTLAAPFYEDIVIADAFVVLKLYLLIKGVQRVVFQAFYRELTDSKKAFFIDKIGLIIGFLFFVITLLYSEELILFAFSEAYLKTSGLFVLIGITTLVSSVSITASPRMLLIKKDKSYIQAYLYALIGLLLFLFFVSKSNYFYYGIIGAILFGELILNAMFFSVLRKELFTKKRIYFLTEISILFFCLVGVSILVVPTTSVLINSIMFISYGIYFLIKHKSQFFSIEKNE